MNARGKRCPALNRRPRRRDATFVYRVHACCQCSAVPGHMYSVGVYLFLEQEVREKHRAFVESLRVSPLPCVSGAQPHFSQKSTPPGSFLHACMRDNAKHRKNAHTRPEQCYTNTTYTCPPAARARIALARMLRRVVGGGDD